MESVNRYNVVLVHGAADRWQGLDCENGDPRANGRDYEESYNSREGIVTDASTCHPDTVQVPDADNSGAVKDSVFTRCDTAYYNPARIGGVKMSSGKIGGTAAGMMKEMVPFLNDELFDTPNAAYLQRPFVHPAGSPALNGNEIGQSNWKGANKCSARRSLIEEAQEFKAHGQDTLKMFRESPVDQYRTIPSRNILVGHSMGGVAIREYVQGPNYKRDVDKFVTLDSPHEGTGALNALLDLDEWRHQLGDGFSSSIYAGMSAAGIALLAVGKTPSVIYPTLITMAVSFGGDALQQVAKELAWNLYFEDHGYDYRYDDGLVAYIDPEKKSSGINNLKGRAADSTFPMARLLGSENSMTFTDPNSSFREYFNLVVPEIISVPLMNAGYHFFGGDGSTTVRVVNAETGFLLGIAGITVQENGSALIPTSSGLASNTDALESGKVDIVRKTYNAAVHAETGDQNIFTDIFTPVGLSMIATDVALSIWCSACAAAAKVAIGVTGSLYLVGGITASTYLGVQDLIESHDIPKNLDFHRSHFGEMKNYSKIQGKSQNVTPYLMENFLYEKPFVNLGLFVSDSTLRAVEPGCYYEADDANKQQLCEIGLYGADGKVVASNGKKNYSEFRKGDLKFHSESDWSKMGVKVDRWEKVDGLKPDGSDNPGGVPIRHVERYEVPAITVEDWINKYSFVVDDLMPHRLRQIRMNFNYQEEIAWECDISKSPEANDACTVYGRSGGGAWTNPIVIVDSVETDSGKIERRITIDKVPHPVKKNGQFDFVPGEYGYNNLLAIQKDNQNTVTISTVNKIGLSNTQRFYYLFKATANKLDPVWPQYNMVLNKIKNFKAYASALGYQGFRVMGAKDKIVLESGDTNVAPDSSKEMSMGYESYVDTTRDSTGRLQDLSTAYFTSKWEEDHPAEGKYHWEFVADIRNMVSDTASKDSSNTYNVSFSVDTTAPIFNIVAEGKMVNPDSIPFLARFAWADSANSPDIRAMRISLEKANGNSRNSSYSRVADFPALYDVCTPEFAIQWNNAVRNSVRGKDGYYRIRTYAVDNAVPDENTYTKMNGLVSAIVGSPGNVSESSWPDSNDFLNVSVVYDTFFVDTRRPGLVNPRLEAVSSSGAPYLQLQDRKPARNPSFAYASYDSLLKISYVVRDLLDGRDSEPVTVAWQFVHDGDPTKIDHAGDSVLVKSGDIADTSWTEMAGMRLEDGDYEIRALVRDAAKNDSLYRLQKKLRVDKTAPYIESLVSSKLVYPDSDRNYSAKIVVNERQDVVSNRTGMNCFYQVSGSGRTTSWKRISDKTLKNDSATFNLDSIGDMRGKCYLDAVCIDAAGNASVKTDLFFIGERTPVISSPRDSAVYTSLVAITGVAPPVKLADSLNTVYRLRYANIDSLGTDSTPEWKTSNIFVVSALQNSSHRNVSKVSQSNDAVLGYLDRKIGENKYLEGMFAIELGVCAGENCIDGPDSLWKTDTSMILLGENRDSLFNDVPDWRFSASPDTAMHIGTDTLRLSLYQSGKFNGSYFLRVYAEDSKHVGMFDESVSKVWRNPYYGAPADTSSDSSAVWFYELDGQYHLKWKGLAAGDTLKVSYDSAGFGNVCSYSGCESRPVAFDMGLFSATINSYLEDFPEWIPPSRISHEMFLFGNSGHAVMTATEAFRVSRAALYGDSTLPKMKAYFGSSDVDGFYWIADGQIGSDTLNPLVMGWSVNPRAYGLTYAWTGTTEMGKYPASGKMTIHAEVTENVSSNPHVFLDSATVVIVPDSLRISLADTLPDFVLLKNDSTKVCKSDTTDENACEKRVLWLRTMVAKYGIKNRDANVGIYVVSGSDTVELQNISTVVRANSSDTAYQISWNGKDSLGHVKLEIGEYKLLIVANSTDGENSTTAEAVFKVKHAETMLDMTPDHPKNEQITVPSIHVSEALYDSRVDAYRYEPVADYLVKANLSGWKLPDSLRKGEIPLTGQISGSQEIIGYEPKRFSLAIKRHRKELKLVAVRYLRYNTFYVDCGDWYPLTDCEKKDANQHERIFVDTLHFNSMTKTITLTESKRANDAHGYYGYDFKKYDENGYDITVFTLSGWKKFLDEHPAYNKSPLDDISYNPIKLSPYQVWTLDKISRGTEIKFPSPYESYGHDCGPRYSFDVADVGCKSDSTLDSVCVNGDAAYDMNANLFKIEINPGVDGKYYTGYGVINPTADNYAAYTVLKFNVTYTIPDTAYWNAAFGMDNLVNRTVRFDHTNKTVFGNDGNGYWAALDSLRRVKSDDFFVGMGSYHDGNEWKFDKTYGLLTPFETQRLHYFPSSYLEGGLNTFLFADEDSAYSQAARFDLRFYTPSSADDFLEAKVLGAIDINEPSDQCNFDPTNVLGAMGIPGFCEIKYSGLSDTVKNTPYFAANTNVEFFVGRNTRWSSVRHRDSIAYPAPKSVTELVKDSVLFASKDSVCKDSAQDWNFVNNGVSLCYKYYNLGSRAHYYYGDYTDSVWSSLIIHGDSVINNIENATSRVFNSPQDFLYMNVVMASEIGKKDAAFTVRPSSDDYDNGTHRYYIRLDTAVKINSELVGGSVHAKVESLKVDLSNIQVPESKLSLSGNAEILYIKADSFVVDTFYRMSKDPLAKSPVRPKSDTLTMNQIYRNDDAWVNDVVVNSAELMQLDSSKHSHLLLDGKFPDSLNMLVKFRDADSITVKRPKELVEVRAYLDSGVNYRLAYLNGEAFYAYPKTMLDSVWRDSLRADSSGWYRLGWFDVNRLQGNTQLMLLWGDDDGTMFNFSKFDMVIGRLVDSTDYKTVKSLFEEVSVTFPEHSISGKKNITVRTVEASDYSFDVFNNLALKGPVVEVLPRMTFADTARPRIQMKISYEEMEAMHATPQTVRLYKVDFANKQFVPLTDVLYGYLDKFGKALVEGASDTVAACSTATDERCYTDKTQWAYLLISAETRTFSVFTAMDSAIAETPNFSVTVLPEIASTANRTVRVDGISRFRLYVDDDSLWANRGDSTLPDTLAFTADSNGFARIALPSRGNAIDTSYVFVVALGEPDADGNMEELPAAPAVARALTVNAQFACSVPSDSLWLGLDNGYMAYGASCTHPGYGLVSLYRDGKVVAEIRGEIPDTVIYDGSKTSGVSGLGKIASGIYESRYVGVSALGMDMQIAGPRVYTDSLRPAIRNFSVQDSSEVLDRIFTATADVYDSESGVARVIVTPVFGGDTLRVMNVMPDSAGHVSASVRISRKQLAECTGCYLSMEMRVEDYGHNHAEQKYVSDEKLYPYPTELALWYPARESSGKIAHELLGTGHNLGLSNMSRPWGSDVGLYFGRGTDFASGNGLVDFGSTPSYSFEARIKRGSGYSTWRRVLGFAGVNGLDIKLMQRGGVLKLVEGSHSWESELLPISEKSWAHVVVTVDSAHVKFYVDGELKKVRDSGISQERELEGAFSMGKTGSDPSYLGNIADIRMYSRALTAAEVEELSKPVTDAGEVSDVIVIAVKDMEAVSGFSNEFSCSVAGNKYLVSGDSATLAMSVIVENTADYNVVLYARSATAGDKPVYVGETSMLAGMAAVSNTWRAVAVSGVSVHLAAGTHTLTLKVPAGIQIGGAALTTANIPASMIAWGVSTSDKVAGIVPVDTVRKIKSYLRYEGYPETSTLRPRIRLRNVSNEPVNGFSVRYYFRGEDASQAGVDRYWPNYGPTFPAVHSESANTGYVEWAFAETIPVAGTVFGGDGPHFGLYNSDFTPWSASDDPSFVDPNSGLVANIDGFYEDAGVVVLDKDNNLIGGSCAEMEDPVSLETKVRVLAADMRGDNQASEIHFNVENTGNVSLKNFDVRYYFFVEEGLAPDYEINDKSECASASMESLGSGRWQVTVHCDKPLAAGKTWQNPVKVALHLPGWAAMWNANDDPSHDGLGMMMRVASGICVFDSTGYMLYGNTPVWALPAPDEVNPDSIYNVDFGYHAPGSVPIIRTPEGLVITMDNWSYVELSLVTALGTPVKSIFSGTLAPGEQFVRVDWNGIDMNRTYLMLKVNGSIKSTKKLSLL
jgi:hypothetical protein